MSYVSNPQTDVARGFLPGRNVRSKCRCSCPAVYTTTRILLRSSSTHEPSDPPLRVGFCVSGTQMSHRVFTSRTFINSRLSRVLHPHIVSAHAFLNACSVSAGFNKVFHDIGHKQNESQPAPAFSRLRLDHPRLFSNHGSPVPVNNMLPHCYRGYSKIHLEIRSQFKGSTAKPDKGFTKQSLLAIQKQFIPTRGFSQGWTAAAPTIGQRPAGSPRTLPSQHHSTTSALQVPHLAPSDSVDLELPPFLKDACPREVHATTHTMHPVMEHATYDPPRHEQV
jgi:hypothetical protein